MGSTAPKKIALIQTSTRALRIGPTVIEMIKRLLLSSPSYSSVEITTVDLNDFSLPIFNEPIVPAMVPKYGQFQYEHSKAWSAAIAPYDAYIFVSPEYNFGPPGGVKNAIDYLYNEWIGKPIFLVTYGIMGGKNAGDVLRATFNGMKLKVVETRAEFTFVGGGYGDDTQAAVGMGKLGETSLKDWEENGKADLLKGFEELVGMIESPAAEKAA